MKIDYNTFRVMDEKPKIQKVKQYFRSVAKPGQEMAWWIGDADSESSVPMTIRFLNDLTVEEKKQMTVRMFILSQKSLVLMVALSINVLLCGFVVVIH